MALDHDIKEQLAGYLALMEGPVEIKLDAGPDEASKVVIELLNEMEAMTPLIKIIPASLKRRPSFSVNRPGEETGITFAGAPMGHEFTSLVLAILQVSGRPPKVEDRLLKAAIALEGKYEFETYVSLSCHNCPDVVQALNLMALVNPGVTHTMIEGGAFQDEIKAKDILAVPAVYLNGEFFEGGRTDLEAILGKLDGSNKPENISQLEDKEPFDMLVVGGGPGGVSAAIYAARKGIRTGLLAERFGGQVQDTMGIENLISVPYTEGPKLAAALRKHLEVYDLDLISGQRAKGLTKNEFIEVALESGARLKAKSVVLSTGARWRNLGVPGEEAFKNKGVAYCPHCDGPLFKGQDVAVIGGGNSGVEAAIDLAGMVKQVTLLEFLPDLKADQVLQKKLYSLPNVKVLTNVKTKEIVGGKKVSGLIYEDRQTNEETLLQLQGVFIQIGLVPNTEWLEGSIDRNKFGEILIDAHGQTSLEGVFAAGDCTTSPYKQIIISMGSGATAALSAFDYLIRTY